MVVYLYNPLFFVGVLWVVVGLLLAISTDSCVTAWLGMEVNLVGLMGVFAVRESLSTAVKIKYFVIQCIASSMFLVGVLSSKSGESKSASWMALCGSALVQLSLLMKIGGFPVYTWVPSVINSSDWPIVWVLSTIQKVVPLMLLGVWGDSMFVVLSMAGSALVGGVGGLNQNSVRGIIAYSSFVHTSWMMGAVIESLGIFVVYFFVYSVQLGVLAMSCHVAQRSTFFRGSGMLVPALSMMGLSGMPPFSGFVPKLLLLMEVDYKGMLVGPLLGSVLAMKYYVGCACMMMLEVVSIWDRQLSKYCFFFVTFNLSMFSGLFWYVHFMFV